MGKSQFKFPQAMLLSESVTVAAIGPQDDRSYLLMLFRMVVIAIHKVSLTTTGHNHHSNPQETSSSFVPIESRWFIALIGHRDATVSLVLQTIACGITYKTTNIKLYMSSRREVVIFMNYIQIRSSKTHS